MQLSDDRQQQLIEFIDNDYEECSENSNKFVKSLMISTYAPLQMQKFDEPKVEVKKHKQYMEILKNEKENFIKVARPLLQKIIGIKLFFDQYDSSSELMKPELLISNCSLSRVVQEESTEKLKNYLEMVNTITEHNDTIWFAIVPGITLDETKKKKRKSKLETSSNIQNNNVTVNSIEDLSSLMSVMEKFRIQTFFNFTANEKSTFNDLNREGLGKYIKKTEILRNSSKAEYAIPCIPNFTILPDDKSNYVIGKEFEIQDGNAISTNKSVDVMLGGLYVDSAYVAAGIIAACQCPAYLRDKFKSKIVNSLPGVRFDIEEGDNRLKTVTTLAREISGYPAKLIEVINENAFGIIFSSDSLSSQKERVSILKARNLLTNENNAQCERIFRTLTLTYILRIFNIKANQISTKKTINNFFNEKQPDSMVRQWRKNEKYLNGICRQGDNIITTFEENDAEVKLEFDNIPKILKLTIT